MFLKLAVFDFDSTLMDGETINLLAKAYGSEQQVSEITKEAMAGKLDFPHFMQTILIQSLHLFLRLLC